MDCLVMCHLDMARTNLATLVEIVDAVTGWGTGIMELLRIQERVITVARLFNIREGFTSNVSFR
jgi:aldehyde:ferredoxin oxidoreductase